MDLWSQELGLEHPCKSSTPTPRIVDFFTPVHSKIHLLLAETKTILFSGQLQYIDFEGTPGKMRAQPLLGHNTTGLVVSTTWFKLSERPCVYHLH